MDLHKSQIKVLNLTQTFPKPNPCGAPVPQLGQTILCSSLRSFFNFASGVTFDDIIYTNKRN